MGFDIKQFGTAAMVLFAVIDIVGSLPVIIDLRQKVGHIQSEKASIVSLVIMVGFLFLGESILKLIGIDVSSFAIAGSIVLFVLALEMILGVNIFKGDAPATASVVPIAFPLIAGAGTMTTLVSLRAEFALINIILAILLNIIVVYAVLKSSGRIAKLLGSGGIAIVRKVFGIVLLAIAVKLFRTNLGL